MANLDILLHVVKPFEKRGTLFPETNGRNLAYILTRGIYKQVVNIISKHWKNRRLAKTINQNTLKKNSSDDLNAHGSFLRMNEKL